MSTHSKILLAVGVTMFFIHMPTFSFGCVWVNGTTLDGLPHRHNSILMSRRLATAMNETPKERLEELRSRPVAQADKSSKGELRAVEAMLSGNPESAVSMLLKIEHATPGYYSTAANLGTAYELVGDNENALKWTTEGIARNQDSHLGTEWLHQLILETKIRLQTDPKYLGSHRIISLPEKFGPGTLVEAGGEQRPIMEIARSIDYQLNERMVFVKPPDPIVADLLFTYAEIEARIGVVESALPLLDMSRQYGFTDPALLQQVQRRYESAILLGKIYFYLAVILIVGGAVGGLFFFFRKKRFFLTRAAYLKHREETRDRYKK